jgi:hypothetical protein
MMDAFRTLPGKDRLEFGLVAGLLLAGMLAMSAILFF